MTDTATDSSTPAQPAPVSAGATGTIGTILDSATAAIPRPGRLPDAVEQARALKDKPLCSQATLDAAAAALGEITEPLSVGAYAGSRLVAERLVTHLFECNLAGYHGWRWAVTVARPPRGRSATICEMELLPGEEALLAPEWVPWADRLQPGDISRSDRLPRRETDERLEPGWEATGDEEGDRVALDELDLGRARVLSPEGLRRAAQRWYDGENGPDAEGVRKAHASCSTCGFFLPMAGPLRRVFGVCANEWAVDDGRVVSLDHGCGAHSETGLPDQGPEWPVTPSRMDDRALVQVGTDGSSLREDSAHLRAEDTSKTEVDADAKKTQTVAKSTKKGTSRPRRARKSQPAEGEGATVTQPDSPDRAGAGEDGRVHGSKGTDADATGDSDHRAEKQGSKQGSQERRAAALSAVADLAATRETGRTGTGTHRPSSLDELEALLPRRR